MFTQSFPQVTPLPRYDGIPWTLVIVQEAPPVDGVFVTIATVAVVPVDPTPDTPDPMAITITTAMLAYGRYRFAFLDALGNQSPFSVPILAPDIAGDVPYLPTLADVGALARARTKDSNGVELGTFTAATRPTDSQVLRLIDLAAAEVATRTNQTFSLRYYESARSVIALRTAMSIEVSYFPEETDSRDSAYGRFAREYADALGELTEATGPLGLMLG